MTNRTKYLALSGALLALLFGLGFLAPLAVDKTFLASSVEALIQNQTGLEAVIEESVSLRFLPWPEVELRGLRVGDPAVEQEIDAAGQEVEAAPASEETAPRDGRSNSADPARTKRPGRPDSLAPSDRQAFGATMARRERFFLRAARLELSPSLLSLLRGRLVLRGLKAEGVRLRLIGAAGRESVGNLLGLLAPLAGAEVRLRDSSLVLIRFGDTAERDRRLTISDASLRAVPLRLDDFFRLEASCLLTVDGLVDSPARLTARGEALLRPAPARLLDTGLKALRLSMEKADATAPSLAATLDMTPGSGQLRARDLRLIPAAGSEIAGRVELSLSGRAGLRFDLTADDLRAEMLAALPWRGLETSWLYRPAAGNGGADWPAVEGRLNVARLRGFGLEARQATFELTGAEGSYVTRHEMLFPGARLQGETRLKLDSGFELAEELAVTAGGYAPTASTRTDEAPGLFSARLGLRDAPEGRRGEVVVPVFSPGRLLGALGLSAPAAPRQASLSAELAWTEDVFEARSLRIKADETTAQGHVAWSLQGGPVTADLSLDQMDLDRWLAGAWARLTSSQEDKPWAWLDLDARIKAQRLRAGSVDLRRLDSSWTLRRGILGAADLSADCFDGSFKARLAAERGKRPAFDLSLADVDLRALSRRFAGPELLRGRCDVRLFFETNGALGLGSRGIVGLSEMPRLRGRLAASSAKGETSLPITFKAGRKQGGDYETVELLVEFQPAEKPADDKARPPLERFLRGHVAQGTFRAGRLAYGRVWMANLRAKIDARNGALVASPVEADFYRGALAGTIRLDFGASPKAVIDLKLRNFQAGDLTRDVFGLDYVGGTSRADVSLTLEPEAGLELLRNVNGHVRLAAVDGYLRLNRILSAQRQGRRQATDADPVTRYDKATATIPVRNGLASNDDLRVDGAIYNITGEGFADLPQDRLDYVFRLAMTGLPTAPIRVHGPLSAPRYEVQASGVLIDSLSRLGGTIRDLPGQVIDLPRKTLDALRGVFGD